jgi:hypothetical protein
MLLDAPVLDDVIRIFEPLAEATAPDRPLLIGVKASLTLAMFPVKEIV